MWRSRTKIDLIIEVWEKLDCETVGAREIEAINEAVRGRFGDAAVESPMRTARLLADEGAALRHAEIMDLWVRYATEAPHEAEFRNLVRVGGFSEARGSLRNVESLRRKFMAEGDTDGLRQLREEVLDAKKELLDRARKKKAGDDGSAPANAEIAEWLTIWLQSPEIFENWIKLRQASAEFREKFGAVK
jgi:hypothetical protein